MIDLLVASVLLVAATAVAPAHGSAGGSDARAGPPGAGAASGALPDTSHRAPVADHPRVREALELVRVWLEAQRAYQRIPGVSGAVVRDQELLWSGGYGEANRETGEAAGAGTVYSICSISKLFTSIGVMQLRDRGMLELNDPVGRHLSWFDIRRAHPDGPPITIEGLLTHSAGLPRESAHPYWTGPEFDFPTRAEIQRDLSTQETLYPARTYFQYSNLGLSLAGEIVAAVSGENYHDYVRRHILDPLGMEDTWSEIPTQLHGDRMAVGYGAIDRDGRRDRIDPFRAQGIAPAAGFASTVEDLARFASWQFRLEPADVEVLGGNTLREMQRVHWVDPDWDTHWGLGFSVSRHGDETYVGHGGSCPGYRTSLSLQMDRRVATIFAANALGVSSGLHTRRMHEIVKDAIAEAVAGEEAGEPVATPERHQVPSPGRFTGAYDASFGGEIAVVRWKGGLAMVGMPTDDPMESLTRLRHVEGGTFRRVRDDESPGEEIVFETGPDGEVDRMVRFSNHYPRIR